MNYEVTEERSAYLQARGYIVLSACPGSGKTTSIVRKLKDISEFCTTNFGRHTGFACLSFTNNACEEIREKYHDMNGEWLHFPNLVSTIDSFIMETVVLPFWYLYPNCTQRPVVVNDENISRQLFHTKYKDASGRKREALVKELRCYYDLAYEHIAPEKVNLKVYLEFKNSHDKDGKRKYDYCKAVMLYRISKGIITSDDALFMACYILFRHSDIARIISRRYPYIIVDEAQDNSYHQHVFFTLLKRNGLKNLEMVGDPCQSIYRFRSARPEIFASYMEKEEWQTLHFSECRRSNQRIIDFYSKLKPISIPPVRSLGVEDIGIPITIYKYGEGNLPLVIKDFTQISDEHGLKDAAIIARGDSMCRRIAGVHKTDLKYWKSQIPYWIIDALLSKAAGDYGKAFGDIRKVLCKIKYNDNQYEERRQFLSGIEHNLEWNKKILRFLSKIPSMSLSLAEWTNQCCLLLKCYWELDNDISFIPYKLITGFNMRSLSQERVEKYYSSTDKGSNYRSVANTIHSLKGASLDAVLLFMSEDSRGQNISINDFPSCAITNVNDMSEKHNMLYVACSRAKQFLSIAVPLTVNDALIKARFQGLNFIIKNMGVQQKIDFE